MLFNIFQFVVTTFASNLMLKICCVALPIIMMSKNASGNHIRLNLSTLNWLHSKMANIWHAMAKSRGVSAANEFAQVRPTMVRCACVLKICVRCDCSAAAAAGGCDERRQCRRHPASAHRGWGRRHSSAGRRQTLERTTPVGVALGTQLRPDSTYLVAGPTAVPDR